MNFFQIQSTRPPLRPDTIFEIYGWPISNALLFTIVIGLLFFFFGRLIKKNLAMRPRGWQVIVEALVQGIFSLIKSIAGKDKAARNLLPIVGALIVFIGVANSISFIPGFGSITFDGKPLFRTPTNDFNMTVTLALGVAILTHMVSIKSLGVFGHLGKFIQIKPIFVGFKKSLGDGFMAIVGFFIGLMDIISEFAKVVSMSMRLFGNLYAGEMMTVVLYGIFALFLPVPWHAMSLFSGIIQALVFSMLTTVFYVLATGDDPEEARA